MRLSCFLNFDVVVVFHFGKTTPQKRNNPPHMFGFSALFYYKELFSPTKIRLMFTNLFVQFLVTKYNSTDASFATRFPFVQVFHTVSKRGVGTFFNFTSFLSIFTHASPKIIVLPCFIWMVGIVQWVSRRCLHDYYLCASLTYTTPYYQRLSCICGLHPCRMVSHMTPFFSPPGAQLFQVFWFHFSIFFFRRYFPKLARPLI